MRVTSYFDVVLCPALSQILATPMHQEVTFSYYTDLTIAKFHSPVSPDPLNARSLRSGSLSHPLLKNPRSANVRFETLVWAQDKVTRWVSDPAWRYASAVLAMAIALCTGLSVCLSVTTDKSVFYRNCCSGRAYFWHGGFLSHILLYLLRKLGYLSH